jgi:hypothetical protein
MSVNSFARAELTTMTKQVDLYRECPFWDENVVCMNRDCSIITVDEVGTLLMSPYAVQRIGRAKYPSNGELALLVN